MRLLVITQKIDKNDPILEFFVTWVKVFSEKFEKITDSYADIYSIE